MKVINTIYEDDPQLLQFINQHQLKESKNILLQIFTSIIDRNYIQKLLNKLTSYLPHIKIIGTTSDGNIIDNKVVNDTVLSFSILQKSQVETFHAIKDQSSFDLGLSLASQFEDIDTARLTLAFSDGIHTNGEDFLKGLESCNKNIIAGGMASDNGEMVQTFVFTEKEIISSGAVCALFYGEDLIVNRLYNFGWEPIGKKLTITKSKKNRVYEIDGMRAVDTYKKYLGEKIEEQLPKTGVEFPLILNQNGIDIARASICKHRDGSLSFAGNIDEGSKVQFGFGDVNSILNERNSNVTYAMHYPIEGVFIYSCMARRRLLDDVVFKEITPYNQLGATSGFFGNGEFYCCRNKEQYNLLNQTKTILFLSENSHIKASLSLDSLEYYNQTSNHIEALTHLVKETSKELSELNQALESRVDEGVSKLKAIFDATQSLICILKDGYLKESNYAFAHFFKKVDIYNQECFLHQYLLNNGKKDYITEQFIDGLHWSEYIATHQEQPHKFAMKQDGEIYHFLVNVQRFNDAHYIVELTDITKDINAQKEAKRKDKMLIAQSKMAQIGELLSMISHQWRQPLSAISAINLNLMIKNQFDAIDRSYLAKMLEEEDHYIKFLNTTIDDFKAFFKSEQRKQESSFYKMVYHVKSIIEQSLIHHKIFLHIDIQRDDEKFLVFENDLQHVILNIINNAKDAIVAYGVVDGEIRVQSYYDANYMVLEIQDNGGGVDVEIEDKIFQPYFTTKTSQNGIGSGLYISQMIMKKMDGILEFRAIEGGTSFIIKVKRGS